MAVDALPSPCRSKAKSLMCNGRRFNSYKNPVRWSAPKRSSRAGEGELSVGGAEEAADSSAVEVIMPRRWWTKGSRPCNGEGWSESIEGIDTGPGTVKL